MKTYAALALILAVSLGFSTYYYETLPQEIPVHWNMEGEADGFMDKSIGAFLLPGVILLLSLLFAVIPRIDPLKRNIKSFMKYYQGFIVLIALFMLGIHIQMIFWSVGIQVSPSFTVPIAVGILFYFAGVMMKHSKRNFFIGIRTPWTLSSDKVWAKTHKRGSILFKISGVLAIVGVLTEYTMWFILAPVILSVIYLFVYSYYAYSGENDNKKRTNRSSK